MAVKVKAMRTKPKMNRGAPFIGSLIDTIIVVYRCEMFTQGDIRK